MILILPRKVFFVYGKRVPGIVLFGFRKQKEIYGNVFRDFVNESDFLQVPQGGILMMLFETVVKFL